MHAHTFPIPLLTRQLMVLLPFVVHVEELADELVDGVLGLELDVHGEEEGGEEEDGAREADQLGRAQLAGLVLVRVVRPIGPATLK